MILRDYQNDAVNAAWNHCETKATNPCIVIPTGGGKTPIIATMCRQVAEWGGRAMLATHVKELLGQCYATLKAIDPQLPVGIYSAGLGAKEHEYAVTVAGIQSVYQAAMKFADLNLLIIDEAHLIPPDGEGMYRTFIEHLRELNPKLRIVGLTATPYRMKSGMICTPDGILNEVCYEIGVRTLMDRGYLCRLRSKAGADIPSMENVYLQAGEFRVDQVTDLLDKKDVIEKTVKQIVAIMQNRNKMLGFCASVEHAQHVAECIEATAGEPCRVITGDTHTDDRAQWLDDFKNGSLRYLANVNVLTTGFDAPNIDTIAMLRPTMSPGLYYQMAGRGMRLHESKTDCMILDYVGNVRRHGPIDAIHIEEEAKPSKNGTAPVKECPQCNEYVHTAVRVCNVCGHEFPPPDKVKHGIDADETPIISDTTEEWVEEVRSVDYETHIKRGAGPDAPRTLKVTYQTGMGKYRSEWVCVEHEGYARRKALKWWERRSVHPMPEDADIAADVCEHVGIAEPKAIRLSMKAKDKWPQIVGYIDLPQPHEVRTRGSYADFASGAAVAQAAIQPVPDRPAWQGLATQKKSAADIIDEMYDDDDIPF